MLCSQPTSWLLQFCPDRNTMNQLVAKYPHWQTKPHWGNHMKDGISGASKYRQCSYRWNNEPEYCTRFTTCPRSHWRQQHDLLNAIPLPGYSTDTRVRDLLTTGDIYHTCMNPDGWEYNRNNGGAWKWRRKNRRIMPVASFGVDLNRNGVLTGVIAVHPL